MITLFKNIFILVLNSAHETNFPKITAIIKNQNRFFLATFAVHFDHSLLYQNNTLTDNIKLEKRCILLEAGMLILQRCTYHSNEFVIPSEVELRVIPKCVKLILELQQHVSFHHFHSHVLRHQLVVRLLHQESIGGCLEIFHCEVGPLSDYWSTNVLVLWQLTTYLHH